MMPSCEGGDYYFKYLSATLFLTSLCYHTISFSQDSEQDSKSKHSGDTKESSEPPVSEENKS